MAAILTLNNGGNELIVDALKEYLTHVFLGTGTNTPAGTKLTPQGIPSRSSDGSNRIKEPRIDAIKTEYKTYNVLTDNDESKITNFYMVDGKVVDRLFLMDDTNLVHGVITFDTINVNGTRSLYIPEIKISIK